MGRNFNRKVKEKRTNVCVRKGIYVHSREDTLRQRLELCTAMEVGPLIRNTTITVGLLFTPHRDAFGHMQDGSARDAQMNFNVYSPSPRELSVRACK